jgi:small-conductance mechanosensitive channel
MDTILAQVSGIVVLAVGVVLFEEFVGLIISRAAKLAGASPTVARDVRVSLRVIAALVIISGILSITGLASEFTFLTISGVGALAVSLALQTTLTNIISGILLFTDGAIRLNDEITYSGIKGKVVRVALRNTWIMKEDGELVIVSNSSLSSGPLINHTAAPRLKKKYAFE